MQPPSEKKKSNDGQYYCQNKIIDDHDLLDVCPDFNNIEEFSGHDSEAETAPRPGVNQILTDTLAPEAPAFQARVKA